MGIDGTKTKMFSSLISSGPDEEKEIIFLAGGNVEPYLKTTQVSNSPKQLVIIKITGVPHNRHLLASHIAKTTD